MKLCSRCKTEKPIDEFPKVKSRNNSPGTYCRICVNERRAEYVKRNHEKVKASKLKWYRNNKESENARMKIWRLGNKDRMRDSMRAWKIKNSDHVKSYYAEWFKKNPDVVSSNSRNRRTRIANCDGFHIAEDISKIFAMQKGRCANCTKKLFKTGEKKYHVDHIMPLARGGSNWPSNLQCLCPGCNLSKHAKHPDDWAKENGRLI